MVDKKIFEQNIISTLGIENLPDDKKIELIDKMSQLAERRITLRLIDKLSEEDAQVFEGLDDEGKVKFLSEKLPNLEEVIQEEVACVKKEIIGDIENDEALKALNEN